MKKKKSFFIFTIAFMLFVVIGTLTHEYGHILVAKSFGYKTYLHYGSMHSDLRKEYDKINAKYEKDKEIIMNNKESKVKTAYIKALKKLNSKSLLITIGGPTQTILTGMLGLLILYVRSEKRKKKGFQFIDWLAVFLSLFWLREVFNFVTGMVSGLFLNGYFFGGDEANISEMLYLPRGMISIILGILGLLISTYIIFKIIPKNTRLVFIASGLVGGLTGFYVWYQILGPKLLP